MTKRTALATIVGVAAAVVACVACGATDAPEAPPAAAVASSDPIPDAAPVAPLDAAACKADHERAWPVLAPAECAGRRTCVDARRRFWVDGRPFIPRGVYNGGFEYARVLANCPAGAACQASTPADVHAYVRMLADAGFNLIQERSRNVKDLLDAIHAEPRMRIAHLLWSDPFTKDGHDAMVADVAAAAADPSVVMWFGPDEIDLNAGWAMAAGIRRILRGKSAATDALLTESSPGASAYVPQDEPAHDPHGLPFEAALAFDRGLAVGHRYYDGLMPITYPFGDDKTAANEGEWGTWRTSKFGTQAPVIPILQMVGIPEMGLAQPTPAQLRAQILSSFAHGAMGAFYYTLISDKPTYAGRKGWFAPDDTDAWKAFGEMHAAEDALIPVLYSEATEQRDVGEGKKLEWRTWTRGERRVTLIVNPTARARSANVAEIVTLAEGESIRRWSDCGPVEMESGVVALGAYAGIIVETYATPRP